MPRSKRKGLDRKPTNLSFGTTDSNIKGRHKKQDSTTARQHDSTTVTRVHRSLYTTTMVEYSLLSASKGCSAELTLLTTLPQYYVQKSLASASHQNSTLQWPMALAMNLRVLLRGAPHLSGISSQRCECLKL
jgi:hypothetical protein